MAGPQANPLVMLAKGPRMDLMGLLQVLGQVRAGTGPLTEAELQELERLVSCDGPLFAGQNPASGYGGNFRVYRAQ
jgi:hypothetical protein